MTQSKQTKTLVFDFVINTLLTVVELITGVISGSVALLAEGFQNLTDSIVLTVAYITERLTSRKISASRKVTIHRTAGCVNAAILMALAIYICALAIYRLAHPQEVNNVLVIAIGILSVSINWYAAALLYKDRSQKSFRAPYVGLVASGFSGMGVLLSGILSQTLHINRVDVVMGLLIAAALFVRSTGLFLSAIKGK